MILCFSHACRGCLVFLWHAGGDCDGGRYNDKAKKQTSKLEKLEAEADQARPVERNKLKASWS